MDRCADCGSWDRGGREVVCQGCGEVHEVAHRCGLRSWCGGCARRWSVDRAERIAAGLVRREREVREQWNALGALRGLRPELRLVTLTVPRHEAGPEEALSAAKAAWNAWRTWLWTEVRAGWARRLRRRRDDVPASWCRMPYALAWEMTDGTDGTGHAHAHLAVFLPFVSVQRMSAAWRRYTGGHVHLSRDATGATVRTVSAKSAGRYLAKYVTKGSEDLSPANLAAWVRATTGRRVVSCSRGLLGPPSRVSHCCEREWSVRRIHPGEKPSARGPPANV